jgi:hypothetical protein
MTREGFVLNADLTKFDDIVNRIHRQQDYGFALYSFLAGIVNDADRTAKFNNSYAGHAMDLCIRSVQTGLVLFCSRHWDTSADAQSIPAAKQYAERALNEIISRHRAFFIDSGIERDAQEFSGYFENLSAEVDRISASPTQSQIRVLRTEQYAHLNTGSRDRERAISAHPFFDMDDLTIDALLGFARQTLELGNRFIYLQRLLAPEFDGRVSHISRYYDKFWDNLPVFSEIEGPL